MTDLISSLADSILALINSKPQSPTKAEIEELLRKSREADQPPMLLMSRQTVQLLENGELCPGAVHALKDGEQLSDYQIIRIGGATKATALSAPFEKCLSSPDGSHVLLGPDNGEYCYHCHRLYDYERKVFKDELFK